MRSDAKDGETIDPECKVAIVLGGSSGMGLSAADSLLYYGARIVILADEDPLEGKNAAQNLCDFYGKNRARFFRCDLRSFCQLEGVFEEAVCKYKKVDVLFSNLDRSNSRVYSSRVRNCNQVSNVPEIDDTKLSNTARAIKAGVKYMGSRENDKSGGIIINGATIIGFMGWPEDPMPIYCFNKEPVAETTMDSAKIYAPEKTGVRIVALLRSQRPFSEIGLPDFPNSGADERCNDHSESRIGKALIHVMSRASTGTTWLSEPAPCIREIPWQIHFPPRHGESVDPRIYEKQKQNYAMAFKPIVTASSTSCNANCPQRMEYKKK
ncbi:15-hydroxyprostaglandin dehydrogenase [NAD(+)]-like [Venturia canescens]|uniref:15-hydroxyprostaglandin dehydrogenase [NAD(+)]-like n=1 Tax=Venturia canescens TaxID=32260 RepID=UPI001C9C55B4|nr:15-hydroxyprostaglandin dehydrogenase [NAD(+)]-like [Venturia canescens]